MNEFRLNLAFTPNHLLGQLGVRISNSYDINAQLVTSGVVASTTSWTSLSVASGMNTDRGILFMHNVNNVVVRVRSGSGPQFADLPVTSNAETDPAFPFLIYGSASADIQHSTASGTGYFFYAWFQR